MASCNYCDTFILFGGVQDGELRQHAQLILASAYAEQLAQEEEGLPPVLEDSP
jgi:hypothetical protein